ncbi:g1087 [Coccomyxa viridis]|uniref:G1087 protein n=1 Tax=Coccomyxa viridis TaxID=1274662 RepID=A0ABP1FJA9_9CHLO
MPAKGRSKGQAVTFKGHSYGVGVRLSSTNKVLLAVENFEDVEPEGMLRQACEAEAGCPGYIETSSGMYWPSSSPLERKGWYYFTPRPTLQGVELIFDNCLTYLARAFKTLTNPSSKGE